jgi:hypothetical protein
MACPGAGCGRALIRSSGAGRNTLTYGTPKATARTKAPEREIYDNLHQIMAEGSGGPGALEKFLERFGEGVPGFAIAAIAVGFALPFVQDVPPQVRPFYPAIAVGLAYVGNKLGHDLDRIYDRLTKGENAEGMGRFRCWLGIGELVAVRRELADEWGKPTSGLFAKASQIVSKTEAWEKKLKRLLEFSKAFRALLVIVLFAVVITVGIDLVEGADLFSREKVIVIASLILCLVLFLWGYLGLRIKHVTTVYREALNVHHDHDPQNRFLRVAQTAIPLRHVLLCKTHQVGREEFKEAQQFVSGLALMHVVLMKVSSGAKIDGHEGDRAELDTRWLEAHKKIEPVPTFTDKQQFPSEYEAQTEPKLFDIVLTVKKSEDSHQIWSDSKVVRAYKYKLAERINFGIYEKKKD